MQSVFQINSHNLRVHHRQVRRFRQPTVTIGRCSDEAQASSDKQNTQGAQAEASESSRKSKLPVEGTSQLENEDGIPIWELRQQARDRAAELDQNELPFWGYLLIGVFFTIAAVGSVNIFFTGADLLQIKKDTTYYLPCLGALVVTTLPLGIFYVTKAISRANIQSQRSYNIDGL